MPKTIRRSGGTTGGPKITAPSEYKVSDPNQIGRDTLEIKSATLSSDGKTVSLAIAGLHPVMQMAIKLRVDAADKTPIELEIDHTINRVPAK